MGTKISQLDWISITGWFCALLIVSFAVFTAWGYLTDPVLENHDSQSNLVTQDISSQFDDRTEDLDLPEFNQVSSRRAIARQLKLDTIVPNRPRQEIVDYTVVSGDSVFAIAQKYSITPETVLWSNYDLLKDNPHSLSIGMTLTIPPENGVFYQWLEGDSLEAVSNRFSVNPEDIVNWPGNRIDLVSPQIEPGQWVMIPGGQREFQQWIIPTIPRGAAGVSAGIYGSGACPGGYEDGLYGSGAFIWPTVNHTISGNDYWSGHLAIDIGAPTGEPVLAADSGVIVFSGWATGGYGYTVAIDHGNGYQTLYAHLNSASIDCGQSVSRGQRIAYSGSTGNSTGPHLHFEVRYQGGFVNPWYVLPAP
ncbi:MAG: M23 family metallopeptidase [Anaerolineales bacterium]